MSDFEPETTFEPELPDLPDDPGISPALGPVASRFFGSDGEPLKTPATEGNWERWNTALDEAFPAPAEGDDDEQGEQNFGGPEVEYPEPTGDPEADFRARLQVDFERNPEGTLEALQRASDEVIRQGLAQGNPAGLAPPSPLEHAQMLDQMFDHREQRAAAAEQFEAEQYAQADGMLSGLIDQSARALKFDDVDHGEVRAALDHPAVAEALHAGYPPEQIVADVVSAVKEQHDYRRATSFTKVGHWREQQATRAREAQLDGAEPRPSVYDEPALKRMRANVERGLENRRTGLGAGHDELKARFVRIENEARRRA